MPRHKDPLLAFLFRVGRTIKYFTFCALGISVVALVGYGLNQIPNPYDKLIAPTLLVAMILTFCWWAAKDDSA